MKLQRLLSLRLKFLLFATGSLILTAVFLYVCWKASEYLLGPYMSPVLLPFRNILRAVVNGIGSVPAMAITGLITYVLVYFALTRGTTRDLKEMDEALEEIAAGRLDVRIPVRTADELGAIAKKMNQMTGELNSSLSQIRSGLEEIAEGHFDRPIPALAGELAKVADSINSMAQRLSRSIEEERNSERSKNDLITGVSHDLRTPLTSILGFLEAIEEDRYKDETELRYYVNIAYEKARGLKKLIDDLFEYTRVNNGLPLQVSELDLSGFLRQLAEEFVPLLEQSGMTCRITAGEEPVTILADGDLLVRVFGNLLANAVQYGAKGKYVDISITREGEWAVVRFTNYGDEIPHSSLPHLFERFYRIEGSRSKETGGTGLGLAIAKSIVDVHGGHISAASNRQRTVFETRFRLAERFLP
ncbi:sensor histidine kinase [Paenibacillus phocaensis]|uniref:sensor histidine kinase n=1 Tax=Paenibacillus phocaensis TaxID=1776378 RepID=UPI000839BB23|nr:HAMP domain-containing sensor histidine kinase [Paenibacillus phocaensis]